MRGYEREMREPVTVNRANRHRGEVEAVPVRPQANETRIGTQKSGPVGTSP